MQEVGNLSADELRQLEEDARRRSQQRVAEAARKLEVSFWEREDQVRTLFREDTSPSSLGELTPSELQEARILACRLLMGEPRNILPGYS